MDLPTKADMIRASSLTPAELEERRYQYFKKNVIKKLAELKDLPVYGFSRKFDVSVHNRSSAVRYCKRFNEEKLTDIQVDFWESRLNDWGFSNGSGFEFTW